MTQEEQRTIGEFQILLRMVDLNVSDRTAFLILKTADLYRRKKGKSNVHDAIDIVYGNKSLFGEEVEEEKGREGGSFPLDEEGVGVVRSLEKNTYE